MKYGIEVEGRLKGLRTLFMTAEEALVFFEYKSLKDAIDPSLHHLTDKIDHIYISDHNNTITAGLECIKIWDSLNLQVTLERTEMNNRTTYPDNVLIMLLVSNPSFWDLEYNDQIKFSRDLRVFAVPLTSMIETRPAAFAEDIELNVKREGTPKVVK